MKVTKVASKEQKLNHGAFGSLAMHIDHTVAIRESGEPPVSLHFALSQTTHPSNLPHPQSPRRGRAQWQVSPAAYKNV